MTLADIVIIGAAGVGAVTIGTADIGAADTLADKDVAGETLRFFKMDLIGFIFKFGTDFRDTATKCCFGVLQPVVRRRFIGFPKFSMINLS